MKIKKSNLTLNLIKSKIINKRKINYRFLIARNVTNFWGNLNNVKVAINFSVESV